MIDALDIGYAIKERRAQLGLTQAQVAEMAGISKRCLWSLELGQNQGVQLDKLVAALDALGLDLVIVENRAESSAIDSNKGTKLIDNAQLLANEASRCDDSAAINALAILMGDTK